MSKRFSVRVGIPFVLAALVTLSFSYYQRQVQASSLSFSSNTTSFNSDIHKPIGLRHKNFAEQIFEASSVVDFLFNPFRFAGVGIPTAVQTGCATPSFAPAATSPEAVGLDPRYVGVGFINADTHLDIVTTNNDSASLTILLGNGMGDFTVTPSSPISVGTNPVTVAIGDFNGDSKSDLAVTNEGAATITVLLGNADGTFVNASGSPIAVGSFPRSVAIGNFNGDANSDLVVTNGGSDDVTILLGNGNGTFTSASGSPFTSGDAPFHAVVGNFNADTISDLAIAMLGDGAVRIYLGNGNGTFTQAGLPISAGSFTSFLAQGDFNADTRQDLAAVNRLSNNLVILLGDGLGGFTQASGSPYSTGSAPMAVATADLNLDGKLDIAVANEQSASASIFLGNGDGTFGSPTTLMKGQLPVHLAIADFNGDTKPDIATSDGGDNTVTILLNTCSGGGCPTITVNPPTIPAGTINASYSQTFTQTGGVGTTTLSLTGTLPTGLSFSSPTLSGIPTQTGSFPITVTATDSNGCMGSTNYTLVINPCPTITVNPPTIPAGSLNAMYSQTFTQTGGVGTTTFSLTGTLPTGLSFSDPTLSGTPTQTGSFPITVTATDSNGCMGSTNYTLVINPCPTITVNPSTIPTGTLNALYSQTFTQIGGVGTTTFSLTGTLPTGLSFSDPTLSGTPTQTGSFPITVTATDSNGCMGSTNYTLVISACATITVNPPSLPNGFVGSLYTQPLSATGGTPGYTFTLDSGSFPSGLNISGTDLTGTPTTTGTFNFTIKATDSAGCMGTRAYTVVISGTGLQFYPLAHPIRLVDTRTGTPCNGTVGQIDANTSLTIPARGTCDGLTIPANAAAITGNVTTVNPASAGFLTIYPSTATQPQAANTNYQAGQTLNNVFTVGLGAVDGAFNVYSLQKTDVVVDITGYFAPPGAGGLFFHPLPAPVRLLDTRAMATACTTPGTPIAEDSELIQQGNAICGIPSTAVALVGNATTVGPALQGFLTLFPADATRPLIASGNYQAGQTLNSPFTVGLSPSGQFKIYSLRQTDLVIDVLGYYSADASDMVGIGLLFSPMTPARLLDTRPMQTACFTPGVPIPAITETPQAARGVCTIPSDAQAIVGNVTTVSPAAGGFLTFWPSDATRPNAATSNYAAGVNFNRHYTVGLGADGAFKIYSLTSTHLVIDVSGSFAP